VRKRNEARAYLAAITVLVAITCAPGCQHAGGGGSSSGGGTAAAGIAVITGGLIAHLISSGQGKKDRPNDPTALAPPSLDEQPSIRPIRYHAHSPILKAFSEPEGYGLYTYVLLPRNLDPNRPTTDAIVDKYNRVLRAAQEASMGSTQVTSRSRVLMERNKATNLSVIPTRISVDHVTTKEYNYAVSRQILNGLTDLFVEVGNVALVERLRNGDGPILLTTEMRLLDHRNSLKVAYLDLSEATPSAATALVQHYYRHLSPSERREVTFSFVDVLRIESAITLTNANALLGQMLTPVKDVLAHFK